MTGAALRALIGVAALLLVSCRNPIEEVRAITCPDAYSQAALNQLWGKVPFIDISPDDAADARSQIAVYRKKANAMKDPCWRAAFNDWLDYAQDSADEADKQWRADLEARKLLVNNPPR